jgi:hypothetical protein
MGRPSTFTQEVADAICERIADGESVRVICSEPGMPNRATVLRWLSEHPEFAAKHAHAREAQADVMDEIILDCAMACTPESAPADRVRIGALQWRAARLAPKKYGDKLDMNLSGAVEITELRRTIVDPKK